MNRICGSPPQPSPGGAGGETESPGVPSPGDSLIEGLLWLIPVTLRQFPDLRRLTHEEREDFTQEAALRLILAVRGHDPAKGASLRSWASQAILGEVREQRERRARENRLRSGGLGQRVPIEEASAVGANCARRRRMLARVDVNRLLWCLTRRQREIMEARMEGVRIGRGVRWRGILAREASMRFKRALTRMRTAATSRRGPGRRAPPERCSRAPGEW